MVDAPIRGFSVTWWLATHAGSVLYASGCQISELEHLLLHTDQWENQFQKLEKVVPEVVESIAFLREYFKGGRERRLNQSEALRIKSSMFTLDPETKALVGATAPGLTIGQVFEKRLIVLCSLSGIVDVARRRYLVMWLLHYIITFIKTRGSGKHTPLSVYLEEFSQLTNIHVSENDEFSKALDELINIYSRSHRIQLHISSQSMAQFNESTQRALFSLGTQIFGAMDMESAEKVAKWFANLDPWAHKSTYGASTGRYTSELRVTYLPLAEQTYLAAKRLRELPKFHFLVRPAIEEGTIDTTLYPVTIEHRDKDCWVNAEVAERVKSVLVRRSGLPVGPILADIASRIPQIIPSESDKISKDTMPPKEKRGGVLPAKDPDKVEF